MQEVPEPRIPASLPILSVLENEHPCSYLPNRTANMPLFVPQRHVTNEEFDHMLEHGMRRSGNFAYYTACQGCEACEPVRVDVTKFRWTDSMRRVLNRGDRLLRTEVGSPDFSEERLELFNRHRMQRGLEQGDGEYAPYDYQGFLVSTCCESTYELRFSLDGVLVGLSVIDLGATGISAVYTYFEPDQSKLSLGTYSVLKQIQLARTMDLKWVYLGLYVRENSHLNYKSRFLPQERYIRGEWIEFLSP